MQKETKMYLEVEEREDFILIDEIKFYPHPTLKKIYCSREGLVAMLRVRIKNKIYLLNQRKCKDGYSRVAWTCTDEDNKQYVTNHLVHRLIAETFLPLPNDTDKFEVDHIDSNRSSNNVSNLRYLTKRENLKKRDDSGVLLKKTFVFDKETDISTEYESRQMAAKTIGMQTSNLTNAIKYEQVIRNRFYISDVELTPTELFYLFKENELHIQERCRLGMKYKKKAK